MAFWAGGVGHKEMMQPCLAHLHVLSLVPFSLRFGGEGLQSMSQLQTSTNGSGRNQLPGGRTRHFLPTSSGASSGRMNRPPAGGCPRRAAPCGPETRRRSGPLPAGVVCICGRGLSARAAVPCAQPPQRRGRWRAARKLSPQELDQRMGFCVCVCVCVCVRPLCGRRRVGARCGPARAASRPVFAGGRARGGWSGELRGMGEPGRGEGEGPGRRREGSRPREERRGNERRDREMGEQMGEQSRARARAEQEQSKSRAK